MNTSAQLEAIHAMLETGHRSVRLERHTLPLWGVTFGLLTAFIGQFFHGLYMKAQWLGALSETGTICIIVLAALALDHRLTRTARRDRDETLSLVQRRVIAVVWLIVGLAILVGLARALKGGQSTLGLNVALAGVALFAIGLFADAWLRWSGIVLLCLGAVFMLFIPGHPTLRWLTACTFAVGFPLIQLLSPSATSTARRVGATAVIVLAILASATLALNLHYRLSVAGDRLPSFTLAELAAKQPRGDFVVSLPAGSRIAIDLTLGADWLRGDSAREWQLELAEPLDVVLHDGKVTGRYRIGAGRWFQAQEALYVKQFRRAAVVSPERGLELRREMMFAVDPGWSGILE